MYCYHESGDRPVTLKIDLKPEIEADLAARARTRGLSLGAYIQEMIEQLAGTPAGSRLGIDDWEEAFEQWIESSPDVPHLPDEALRRESLYRRE